MKATRNPFELVIAQSTAANYTSPAYSVIDIDVEAVQVNYDGSPSGTLTIQGSCDHVAQQNPDGTQTVLQEGNFADLYFSVNGSSPTNVVPIPADPSPVIFDLYGSGVSYIRLVYIGSGAGTLSAYVTGKRLGD